MKWTTQKVVVVLELSAQYIQPLILQSYSSELKEVGHIGT